MKKRNKRIIIIIFLIFLLFSIGGKLLNDLDNQNISNSNNNIYGNQSNQNYNYSENHPNITINSKNYNKYYEAKGFCENVVDGDTIDVSGVGRIRLVGINTPERGEEGYQNSTDFVKQKCLGKTVYLDIDDVKNKDKYGRVLAIVYIDGISINEELLKRGYAEIMYIPPSEFQKGFGIIS
ncbi:Endonuclease YncB [bioreactor metagenome]|uniref:Endonuclease YncB n=1 Tax=bioreactor metagenome TaxID=1076179 RepID=A0A644UGV3_9ZZZZ|nr:thermonuclease family protein [Methanobrevibacter sp.]MEA4957721.1 thermonuclease family protein [Methanobrevibacter sp.]